MAVKKPLNKKKTGIRKPCTEKKQSKPGVLLAILHNPRELNKRQRAMQGNPQQHDDRSKCIQIMPASGSREGHETGSNVNDSVVLCCDAKYATLPAP